MPKRTYGKFRTDQLPTTSGYFNNNPHGPAKGYTEDLPIKYVQRERQRNNEDFKDSQLFAKLEADYQSWLKEIENAKRTETRGTETKCP